MVLMALDHVRAYFGIDGLLGDPTDLGHTTATLFLTRWITHFCAPVFFFLTGTSAFLAGEKLKNNKSLSWWLFSRGIWLIFLELTVIKIAWTFSLDFSYIMLVVIWALGWSMVALSLIVFLPGYIILIIGLLIVAGHNLLDGVTSLPDPYLNTIWKILHVHEAIISLNKVNLSVGYPLLPWIGVTALGFCFGHLYSRSYDKNLRIKMLKWSGGLTILIFLVLRLFNLYGDPSVWTKQPSVLFTFFSFINTTKYPPSLLYLCMTLGPSMLFLAFAESRSGWMARKLIIFGRVPFFFYILHLYIIHLAASFAGLATGYKWSATVFNRNWVPDLLNGYGFSIWVVYLVWLGIVIILYPACSWYNSYKTHHGKKWWLKYL